MVPTRWAFAFSGIILGILIGLIGGTTLSSSPKHRGQGVDNQAERHTSPAGTGHRPALSQLIPRPTSSPTGQQPAQQVHPWDPRWWNTNRVIALATCVNVIVLIFQWAAIKRQNRNLVSVERPWVFPGYVNLASTPILPSVPNSVHFNWTNNGRSIGVIVEQNVEVRFVTSLPPHPRYLQRPTSGYGILSPSQPGFQSPNQQTPFQLTLSQVTQLQAGTMRLYWLGYILYEDTLRRRHTYKFCFRYFPGNGIFAADGPKAYNWRN